MVTLRIRVPAPSSMLFANVIAVLGLVAIVIAVGGLAGVWWAVLTAGVFAFALGWVGMTQAAVAEQSPAVAPVDERVSMRAVEEPSAA